MIRTPCWSSKDDLFALWRTLYMMIITVDHALVCSLVCISCRTTKTEKRQTPLPTLSESPPGGFSITPLFVSIWCLQRITTRQTLVKSGSDSVTVQGYRDTRTHTHTHTHTKYGNQPGVSHGYGWVSRWAGYSTFPSGLLIFLALRGRWESHVPPPSGGMVTQHHGNKPTRDYFAGRAKIITTLSYVLTFQSLRLYFNSSVLNMKCTYILHASPNS